MTNALLQLLYWQIGRKTDEPKGRGVTLGGLELGLTHDYCRWAVTVICDSQAGRLKFSHLQYHPINSLSSLIFPGVRIVCVNLRLM